jgi:hypothetical protein
MIPIVCKLVVLFMGIFTLPMALIHNQPYNSTGLTALLTPPQNCPIPCFLGVRPGETTVNAAGVLLESDPAVRFAIYSDEYNVHNIRQRIEWEYRQPHRVLHGNMYVEDSIVRRVTIYDIPLAEVWLSLGKPDISYEIGESQVSPGGQIIENPVMHVSYYADWDVRVDVMAACANLWWDDVQAYVLPGGRNNMDADPGLRVSGMTRFRQQTCRALRYNQRAMSTGGFLTRLSQTYQMIVAS